MTVEAGDALSGHDGTDAGVEPVEAAERSPTSADAAGGDAAGEGAEPAGEAAEEPVATPPPAPAWLTGKAATPWPPPGATAPRARAPGAIPPPRRSSAPGRPAPIPGPPPMPRIPPEPAILGLSRLTRGRFGSRLFTLFFVLVFALIVGQMVVSILYPW
jgi:hypothetical protein